MLLLDARRAVREYCASTRVEEPRRPGLNFNPNWAPLPDPDAKFKKQFDASELQTGPPYRFHQAHCQSVNMDDTPNTDFENC